MIKKVLLLFIIILGTFYPTFSNDFTDEQLDRSIEEFSLKNYDEALKILDSVLKVEPENSIALMYKKTIEDVISIDEEITIILDEELEGTTDEVITQNNNNILEVKEVTHIKPYTSIFSVSSYIGQNKDNLLIVEERAKIVLGQPILEVKLQSIAIDYNIFEIDQEEELPLEDIFYIGNYNIDFGIGYRSKPFLGITDEGGFFDIKLGVTNFLREGSYVVPYIGFDTEASVLSSLGNNIIFNNLWIGGSGSVYSFNGTYINNYKIEGKLGINVGAIKLGLFYNYTNIESFEIDEQTVYGVIVGLNF